MKTIAFATLLALLALGAVIALPGAAVQLPRAAPVRVLYWTAWAEPDGTVHFREDVYGRDAELDAALREPPPAPPTTPVAPDRQRP
ncbi:MAG: hypothetical protein P8177_02525 [Gemmatimonadota bacterium]|jgi:hypothetical protein